MSELNQKILLSVKRLQHALKINGMLRRLPPQQNQHACSHDICSPLNEIDLIRRGILTSPPTTTFVFMCCYEFIHVCTPKHCNGAQHGGSCPISGLSFTQHLATSSYDKNDSRTFGNYQHRQGVSTFKRHKHVAQIDRQRLTNSNANMFQPPEEVEEEEEEKVLDIIIQSPEKKRKRRSYRIKNVERKVQNIIYNLLYGIVRQRINKEYIKKYKHIRETQWVKYKHQCIKNNNGMIDLVYGMIIESNYVKPPPFVILQHDYDREMHYVNLVLQVHKKIVTHTSFEGQGCNIDVEAVTLYVLYSMRLGQTFDGINILPPDPFLKKYLPNVNDLAHFKMNRKKIKQGSKLLKDAYSNAINKLNVSKDELTLRNSGYVPEEQVKLFKSVSRRKKK
jgi:hypothetical protein